MIVKHVQENPNYANQTTAQKVGGLTRYIVNPQSRDGSKEKCIMSGGINFNDTTDLEKCINEMTFIAEQRSKRVSRPIDHFVVSFVKEDGVTDKNGKINLYKIRQILNTTLEQLHVGRDHQVVYGLHADTRNLHLHVELNRIGLKKHTALEVAPRGDYGKLAQTIMAVLAAKHGLTHNQGDHYECVMAQDGKLSDAQERPRPDTPRPTQEARRFERETGQAPHQAMAQRYAVPILKTARTWEELHERLAGVGMTYSLSEKHKGSFLTVDIGGLKNKVSLCDIDRKYTLSRLIPVLGEFTPPSRPYEVKPLQPTPAREEKARSQEAPKYPTKRHPHPAKYRRPDAMAEYFSARNAWLAEKKAAKAARDAELAAIRQEYKDARASSWREVKTHTGHQTMTEYNRRRLEHSYTLAKLLAEKRQKEKKARDEYMARFAYRYPDFTAWKHAPEIAGVNEGYSPPKQDMGILGYVPNFHAHPAQTLYMDAKTGRVDFVDTGRQIFFDNIAPHAVKAGLDLAMAKWPQGITVNGNKAYLDACVRIAALDPSIKITNPELQAAIARDRERFRPAPAPMRQTPARTQAPAKAPEPRRRQDHGRSF